MVPEVPVARWRFRAWHVYVGDAEIIVDSLRAARTAAGMSEGSDTLRVLFTKEIQTHLDRAVLHRRLGSDAAADGELGTAVRLLESKGMSIHDIADALGITLDQARDWA